MPLYVSQEDTFIVVKAALSAPSIYLLSHDLVYFLEEGKIYKRDSVAFVNEAVTKTQVREHEDV